MKWKKMFSCDFGVNVTVPLRTASIAGRASSPISQNHCSEISGSIRSPLRSQ